MATPDLDQSNASFWDELCGTTFAEGHDIDGRTADALSRYDRKYLEFYPYLRQYIQPQALTGQRVLEIGLGYGTIGQQIAAAGATYIGVDLADGPVKMMIHRLRMLGAPPRVIRCSAHSLPFASATFDRVVSIGCLHHTGRLEQSVAEVYRVLRPGGAAVVMVYNTFSYRQWLRSPFRTLNAFLNQTTRGPAEQRATERQRKQYDVNTKGVAAPETVFVSNRRVRELFRNYSRVTIRCENCDDVIPGGTALSLRRRLLRSLGRHAGLDLYVTAQK